MSACLPVFSCVHSGAGGLFGFRETSLPEKHTSASLIILGHSACVSQAHLNTSRPIQVLMRFVTAIDMEVNESKLIFNVRQVTSVLCSLEVVTSSRVLDQSTINVVAALLGFPEVT
jgi:hypothetical protein